MFYAEFYILYKFDNFLCFVNYRPSKLCGKDVIPIYVTSVYQTKYKSYVLNYGVKSRGPVFYF